MSLPDPRLLSPKVLPGDVLVVRDHGFWAWWIRFGERIDRKPYGWNHVVVAHHIDAAGTYWGIEGRPGGVGWRDLRAYLADKSTLTTARLWMSATEDQRRMMCAGAEALLGVPYDWPAIVRDGLEMVDPIYRQTGEWGPHSPAHVVCSSMADYVAERVGLVTPNADQACTPADWAALIQAAK